MLLTRVGTDDQDTHYESVWSGTHYYRWSVGAPVQWSVTYTIKPPFPSDAHDMEIAIPAVEIVEDDRTVTPPGRTLLKLDGPWDFTVAINPR